MSKYPRRKRNDDDYSWSHPAHRKDRMGMERDRQGNLIVDRRPTIMRPERPKIDMGLMSPFKW